MSKKVLKRNNSCLNFRSKTLSEPIIYKLTPDQMYKMNMNLLDYGIEGYIAPKQYFDYFRSLWVKKREKILSSTKHIWPPEDWPKDKSDGRTKCKPKKFSYIDEVQKWSQSYYDKKRADYLIEERGVNITEYKPKHFIDTNKRKHFLEKEEKRKEWLKNRPPYPEYKAEAMEEAEENKKQHENELKKDPYIKLKKKYKDHPVLPRCDKISLISDAISASEQIPFYNTFLAEGEKLKKKKNLFFPKKDYTWKKAPSWKYAKPMEPNMEIKKMIKEEEKQRVNDYLADKHLSAKDLWVKIREGYNKTISHGKIFIKIAPEFKYKETEQYKSMMMNKPAVYIGPQHYWRVPKENPRKKSANKIIGSSVDDRGNKIYYLDRKITDKRAIIPGLRRSIY